MKYSFFTFLVLCVSLSFAQLTVTNNAYIFVDGNGFTSAPNVAPLFVTNEVNLDGANSNIYLRNDAQLIQDFTATTSTNSGTGQLSVYQTGNVNQWAYNYWCSPVGNNSAALGNENARVALLKDATNVPSLGDPTGTTSFSDAVFIAGYNGSATPLTISHRWLWTYQTSSLYADWVYAGETGPILPGLGFTMKGNGTGATGSQLYDFRGKPNNGTMANAVTDNDFTLVGNPYPSAMDSAAFIHDPQNVAAINGTLFYWEQDASIAATQSHFLQDYVGGYSSFTINSSGVIISNAPAVFFKYDEQDNVLPVPPGPPTNGTKMAQRYIPIGQGFMVEGRTGSSGTVRTKNAHRVFEKAGAQSVFFRNSNNSSENTETENTVIQFQDNGLPIVPSDYKRFRINVEFTTNEAKYVRQLLLNFHETATAGFDYGLELNSSDNLSSDAYFSQNDEDYIGQAFPFETALTIPLVVEIAQQQPLTFRIFDIQNFDDSQGIYIHDIVNDVYVDLRQQNYDINIEPGNYTDRFEIVFTTQGTLGVDEFDITSLTIRQNNGINELSVLNPKGLNVKTIEVYDVAGKRILKSDFDSVSEKYNLSTLRLSDGVYVVNVLSNSNTAVKSQKIIVKN